MDQEVSASLIEPLENLPDPRVIGRCDHKLTDIVVLAVCAVISGAASWVEVEQFGKLRESWWN